VRKLRWLAVIAVVAIVASACGRSSDDKEAGGSDTTAAPSGTTETTSAADAPGTFGDLTGVCGPAKGTNKADSDVGVTADSVQVSVVSDPGFAGRPGLNQELFDSADAFAKWCNDAGGISGRKIVLKKRDAKLTEFQQRVIEACQEKDFMMVGGGAVFDDTGQKERLACDLPTIAGYVVTAQAAGADLTYQSVPNPIDSIAIGDYTWLQSQYPDSIDHVGVLTGSIATTVMVAKRNEEAVKDLGWKIVYEQQYNAAGETTWRPFAEAVKNAGVKGLIWVGEPVNFANMLKALSDIGYKLDWARADANHYDQLLISEGGAAANGAYVRSVFYPFLSDDDAKDNPATLQYRKIIQDWKKNGKIAYLGVQGFSAWLLWAKAATDCGEDLTRDCVWENISQVHDWTGGGLHAPQDVGGDKPGDCYALEQVKDGKFVLADINPTDGIYACDSKYVVALKGNYGEGAKCPNPAYASDPKPSNCAKS
jgi:ABC-type branched-subunit amino acid transport system substrate-binding protein